MLLGVVDSVGSFLATQIFIYIYVYIYIYLFRKNIDNMYSQEPSHRVNDSKEHPKNMRDDICFYNIDESDAPGGPMFFISN